MMRIFAPKNRKVGMLFGYDCLVRNRFVGREVQSPVIIFNLCTIITNSNRLFLCRYFVVFSSSAGRPSNYATTLVCFTSKDNGVAGFTMGIFYLISYSEGVLYYTDISKYSDGLIFMSRMITLIF